MLVLKNNVLIMKRLNKGKKEILKENKVIKK